jgi:nucleotide-binding universal stress UspA family protein
MIQELYRRVLVGADGTGHSQFAIDAAIAVATKFNSELHCVGVMPRASPETAAEGVGLDELNHSHASIRDQVASCGDRARAAGIRAITQLIDGDPESVIESYAQKTGVDLIVVGHHHLNRFRRFLEGSTSESLVEHSAVSVLVARSPLQES